MRSVKLDLKRALSSTINHSLQCLASGEDYKGRQFLWSKGGGVLQTCPLGCSEGMCTRTGVLESTALGGSHCRHARALQQINSHGKHSVKQESEKKNPTPQQHCFKSRETSGIQLVASFPSVYITGLHLEKQIACLYLFRSTQTSRHQQDKVRNCVEYYLLYFINIVYFRPPAAYADYSRRTAWHAHQSLQTSHHPFRGTKQMKNDQRLIEGKTIY